MAPALRFRAVGFGYRSRPVFDGLDLGVETGEMAAILGPNGTGKTTLVRLASAALRPARGTIEIFGDDVSQIPHLERARRVAVVPQESYLTFDFTVREIVRMGRAPHTGFLGLEGPHDREVVQRSMEQAEVDLLAERPFLALSGGERQRVILARALAQEPRLLLLDEPTAFLDLKHRLVVYGLLERLNRETGITVVAAGHDLNLAARHCRRLLLLREGRILADGPPREVLRADLLRATYDVDVEVHHDAGSGLPFVVPAAREEEGGASGSEGPSGSRLPRGSLAP